MGIFRERVNAGMSLGGQRAGLVSTEETGMSRKALGKGWAIQPVRMALGGTGGVSAFVHRLAVAANGVMRLGAGNIGEGIVLDAPGADKRTATRTVPDISLCGIKKVARAAMRRPFEFCAATQVTPSRGQGRRRGSRARRRRGRRGRGRRGGVNRAGRRCGETGTAQRAGTSAAEKDVRLRSQREFA